MTSVTTALFSGLLAVLVVSDVFAQAGALDPSFGTGGIVQTEMALNVGGAYAVSVLPDGGIVASGIGGDSTDLDFAIAKYLPDGALDLSFGNGGKVLSKVTTGADLIKGMVIQPDLKIAVAGVADELWYPDPCVARYLPDGELDTTFGVDGIVHVDLGASGGHGRAIALQPDGKLVVAGRRYVSGVGDEFIVVRMLTDGTMDTGFGTNGVVTTHVTNVTDVLVSVLIQPDGKILAGGNAGSPPNRSFALVRYMPDGSLDTSFGVDGIVLQPVSPTGSDIAWSVALRPDGSIVLGGTSDYSVTESRAVMLAFNADGSPDMSFGGDGMDEPPYPTGRITGRSVLIQPDGKILFTGSSGNGYGDFALCRYMPDGTLDPDFGIDGMVSTNIDVGDDGYALALDGIGSVVVAGSSNGIGVMYDFAVARYLNDLGIGMNEIQAGTVEVFPNPVRGQLMLRVPEGSPIETIDLLNATGELVARYPSGLRVLRLDGIGAGVHILRINGPNNTRALRVVVQ